MEDITSVQLAENIPYFYGVDEPRDPPICEDWFAVVGNLFREVSLHLHHNIISVTFKIS